MPEVDAGHATPDQVRAAQKRKAAAREAGGFAAEQPQDRHAPEAETAARAPAKKTAKRAARK